MVYFGQGLAENYGPIYLLARALILVTPNIYSRLVYSIRRTNICYGLLTRQTLIPNSLFVSYRLKFHVQFLLIKPAKIDQILKQMLASIPYKLSSGFLSFVSGHITFSCLLIARRQTANLQIRMASKVFVFSLKSSSRVDILQLTPLS